MITQEKMREWLTSLGVNLNDVLWMGFTHESVYSMPEPCLKVRCFARDDNDLRYADPDGAPGDAAKETRYYPVGVDVEDFLKWLRLNKLIVGDVKAIELLNPYTFADDIIAMMRVETYARSSRGERFIGNDRIDAATNDNWIQVHCLPKTATLVS